MKKAFWTYANPALWPVSKIASSCMNNALVLRTYGPFFICSEVSLRSIGKILTPEVLPRRAPGGTRPLRRVRCAKIEKRLVNSCEKFGIFGDLWVLESELLRFKFCIFACEQCIVYIQTILWIFSTVEMPCNFQSKTRLKEFGENVGLLASKHVREYLAGMLRCWDI